MRIGVNRRVLAGCGVLSVIIALGVATTTAPSERLAAGPLPLLLGNPNHVQLDVEAATGGHRVAINGIRAGGRQWLVAPSPLFEVAVGACVWNSLGGSLPLQVSSAASTASQTVIEVSLSGCPDVPPLRVVLRLALDGEQVRTTGTLEAGVLPNTSPNGWFGPFMLGAGSAPVFPASAHVALLRSRFTAEAAWTTPYVREEAFVVGHDGIFYGSFVENAGPWTTPAPLYSTAPPENRLVFRPGGPFAAVRRNDQQADLFAVASGGPHAGRVMTVFRVGADPVDPWSTPIPVTTAGPPFLRGAPLAALNLHEDVDRTKNEMEVYVAGNGDGRLYAISAHNDGAFGAPRWIAGGRLLGVRGVPPRPRYEACPLPRSGPVHLAALARNHRQRDLFFIDRNGQLCSTFKIRTNPSPPDDPSEWAPLLPLGEPRRFRPGAPVAAAHGSGNSEHVFAIGTDGNVHWARQKDDGPWTVSPIPVAATYRGGRASGIAAARRTAREIVVAYVVASDGPLDGRVMELRWDDVVQKWTGPFDTRLPRGTADRTIALNLRDGNQLDVLGVADSDHRLWTAGDSRGRSHVRVVLPKLVFAGNALGGAVGMLPVEIAGSGWIPDAPAAGAPWELGMPYRRDPRAQEFGVPQSMNMMELAHVTRDNASFFVLDASPPLESGGSPAQLTISSESDPPGAWQEITGFWTADLRQGQAVPLPTILFGGYPGHDWHPAADIYVAKQSSSRPASLTPSTPDWLRNAGAIYTFAGGGAGGIYLDIDGVGSPTGNHQGSFKNYATRPDGSVEEFAALLPQRLLREAQDTGTDVIYLWDFWEPTTLCTWLFPFIYGPGGEYYFCKGDYRIRNDFGGLPSLQLGIEAVHRAQPPGRVILYVEPFIWGWGSDIMRLSDLYWARKPPSGTPWLPFEFTTGLSYAHSGWQDRFVELSERLIRDTRADGLFLDSGAWRMNQHVETKDEVVRASPREHAVAFLELARRVRRAIRKVNPEAVVLSETTAGPVVDSIDGAVSSDLSVVLFRMRDSIDGTLVATPTRYKQPHANIFSAGPSSSALRDLNQVYAAGHNLALARPILSVGQPYIRRLVSIRRTYANALVEGAQSDLLVRSDVIARRYVGTTQEAITVLNLTVDHSAAILGRPGAGPLVSGTSYCDILDGQTYDVAGGLLFVSVPPAPPDESCPYGVSGTTPCGLRVLVRGPCPAP